MSESMSRRRAPEILGPSESLICDFCGEPAENFVRTFGGVVPSSGWTFDLCGACLSLERAAAGDPGPEGKP